MTSSVGPVLFGCQGKLAKPEATRVKRYCSFSCCVAGQPRWIKM